MFTQQPDGYITETAQRGMSGENKILSRCVDSYITYVYKKV